MKTLLMRLMVVLSLFAAIGIDVAQAQTPTPYATAVPFPNMTRGPIPLERALAGLTFSVLAGAAADTNITVTGITTADRIALCAMVQPDNATTSTMLTVLGTECKITAADTIQVDVTVTTGKQILLVWYNMDSYSMGQ